MSYESLSRLRDAVTDGLDGELATLHDQDTQGRLGLALSSTCVRISVQLDAS
jgi:hypothetical protein